jgi:integrase
VRFTDRSIQALKPKVERYDIWEDGRTGLGLRVSPKGRKSWIFFYRYDRKARRMTLGTYPAVTLADVRMAWGTAKKELELGNDPGAAKVTNNKADREAETISDLIAVYMERHGSKKRTGAEDERVLRREIEPLWGRKKVGSITRKGVIAALDRVEDRGTPVMRNRLLSAIQGLFGVALDRGIIEFLPTVRIRRLPETPRDRKLEPDEIKAVWHGLGSAEIDMSPVVRLALKFALVTGQRRAMIAGTLRSEIDEAAVHKNDEGDDRGVWTIPAERVKATRETARRPHIVPLSSLALELLAEIDELRAKLAAPTKTRAVPRPISPYLFPSPRPERPINAEAMTRAFRNNLGKLGLVNATPHDFRRVVDTNLGDLGISRFDRDRVLGHVDRSTGGRHYDLYDYYREKRIALRAWSTRLEEIVNGTTPAENVVKLTG